MPNQKLPRRRLPALSRRREQARVKLPFPVDPSLRLAQLNDAPLFEGVQAFIPERWIELESYRPRVMLGSAVDLQRLAEEVGLGTLDMSSVDHAIIVLTDYGAPPLTDFLRVVLWQCFGVPLFEVYLGPDHSLLASECEAHEGWHLRPDVSVEALEEEFILDGPGTFGLRTGLYGKLTDETCPCGVSGSRLLEIRSVNGTRVARAFAASA